MCGRYTYYSTAEILEKYSHLPHFNHQTELPLEVKDNFNVSPGNLMPVIVRGEQEHHVEFMVWGLLPSWSKEAHTKLKLINARAEGLFEKPMWKRLVNSRRCVVPARGFYEWKTENGSKQPYYITLKNDQVMSFAGLWDEWKDQRGTVLRTYSIITTTPNKEMSEIHNRMPVILSNVHMDQWLNPNELSQEFTEDILSPLSDDFLFIVPVSSDVNNAKINHERLIYPLENHDE